MYILLVDVTDIHQSKAMRRWIMKAAGADSAYNIYSETQMDFCYGSVEDILEATKRIHALSVNVDTSVIHVDEFGGWSAIYSAKLVAEL